MCVAVVCVGWVGGQFDLGIFFLLFAKALFIQSGRKGGEGEGVEVGWVGLLFASVPLSHPSFFPLNNRSVRLSTKD